MQARAASEFTNTAETANDRLKRSADAWLPRALILATAIHFMIFSFWPDMSVADVRDERADMMLVMPPDIELPPPPQQLARPAAPVVGSLDIPDDVTIPRTDLAAWDMEALAPPTTTRSNEAEEYRVFTPSMVAPRVLNPADVSRALERNYPPFLRDAGIGGTVDVLLWLDDDGVVARAAVGKSSGHPALDEAALKVVDIMKLSPALMNGRSVRVAVMLPVVFTVGR